MDNHAVLPSAGSKKSSFFYGYIVVAVAFFIMVAMWGTYYSFGIFLKPVLTEFGWTRALTSGAFSLSMMIRGLVGIVMGGFNDRLGPRVVMILCGVLLGLGYLLMSQLGAFWQLYLFYGVIIGIGMGGSWVPPLSTVARWFTKRRGMMTGIVVAGHDMGALVAAPVATWLIFAYDWRMSYIILGSLVLVVVVLAAQLLRRDPSQMSQMPYGENKGGEQELKLETEGFSLREAANTRQFWVTFGMFLCFGFAMFTIMVHIVPHATELGISATSAATILATIGGLALVGRVVFGSAGDKIGNRQVYIIGFILMSAALFGLVPARELWMLYLFAVVFGLGIGGLGVSQSPLLARLFGLSSHGLLLGVAAFCWSIGAAIAPFLTGYIFDVTGSYHMAFLIGAGAGIVGLILTVLLKPIRGKRGQNKVPFAI